MRRHLLLCLFLACAVSPSVGEDKLVPHVGAVPENRRADVYRSGITFDPAVTDKLVVLAVEPGSAADLAGIKAGDTVVTLDGKEYRTSADLDAQLLARRGTDSKIVVLRAADRRELVFVDRTPGLPPAPIAKYGQTAGAGIRIGYDVHNNVVVIGIYDGSPADAAGVQLLDRLLTVNDAAYRSTREFSRAIGRYRAGETVRLEVIRNNEVRKIDVVLDTWAAAFDSPRRMAPGFVATDDYVDAFRDDLLLDARRVELENPRFDPVTGRYDPISDEERAIYASEDATAREIAALCREIRALRAELELANRRLQQEHASR